MYVYCYATEIMANNTCLKVYINNVQVPVSTCEKLLGVHIQTKLDWSSHVNNISKGCET